MSVALTVDGHRVEVEGGASVLDAVNVARVYVPQLCKDPERPRLGTCRTCLVRIEGVRGTPTACSTPAADGMRVSTAAPEVDRLRRGVLQLTLDMLPETQLDRLGDLGVAARHYGIRPGRFRPEPAIAIRDSEDASNPVWRLDRHRCILCQRCVTACQDVQRIFAIATLGRSRRTAIGTFRTGPIAASNCTTCGQCWATCPTLAIRMEQPLTGDGPIARRVETTCPYCGVGCGIVLALDARDEIVHVDDVPANASSQGMLCVKGRFGVGFVRSPERLTTPLVRGASGRLEPAGWDTALELVADRFVQHRGRFAALGSAKATNEDGYVLQKLARAVMGTNHVDHCARLCHSPSVAAMQEMLGGGSTSNSYEDFERAGCLMVVGADPDVNHPVIAARVRRGIEEGGAALVVVNPKRTRLCDLADVWLRPFPGTDVALFNGLARVALDEGLWDPGFVRARTEGFEAWRTALAPYTAANVTRLTGVSGADLERAARLFARPPRGGGASVLWGMGITQHTRGTANVQAIVNFVLLTGQVGTPGSGLAPLRGQNNVQGCSDVGVLPDTLPGYQGLGPEARATFERAWGVTLPAEPGLTLTEMVEAAGRGELDALYLTGENPLLTEPNLAHAREALGRLPFLVVQTILPNETTALAHVVLPAASFAEKHGTFTNSERRVQRVRQALEPPGHARADWAITCDIARRVARRLGRPADGFDYRDASAIFAELAALVPFLAGLSHERLERGGIQWPCPTPDHPGTPRLFADAFPRGRARFVAVDQGLPAAELPDAEYPLLLNTGRVLTHWHGGDLTRPVRELAGLYPRLEVSMHPEDAAGAGLADGDRVRVSSRRGALVAVTRVTEDVPAGEIFIPFVRLDDAAVNALTHDVYDPRARIPEYKVCAVRIARA